MAAFAARLHGQGECTGSELAQWVRHLYVAADDLNDYLNDWLPPLLIHTFRTFCLRIDV